MKTLLMDGTEEGIKKHLEGFGINTSEDFAFWGHKHLIKIEKADKFNELAKAMEIKEIENIGSLNFIAEYENDLWTISLTEEQNKFLDNYGDNYKIE